ncbi:MAG TPA: ABC transporter substrate-binding protein [Stellaceae bacterium]|jgi:putative ABC transport system substrate-binding protein|nr:ABC transporter substrate-binding protein [Stellaceae bacterium]
MNRRELIILFGGAVCLSLPAAAEGKLAKIGFLSWFPPSLTADVDNFREGMRHFGYAEGRNYSLEALFAAGNPDIARKAAQKFVGEPVDVLVVVATPAIHIAKEATSAIPIVMYTANALATGLVPSLSHPGGNITGVSLLMTDLAGKRLDLLHQIRPQLRAIGFLGSTKDPNGATFAHETQLAADRLGLTLTIRMIDGPQAIDQAIFDQMKQQGCEAVIVQPIFTGYQDRIVPLAMKDGMPVVSDWADFTDAGGLLSYGAKRAGLMRRTAYYVDRILKGAKPADLPIEQPEEFELVINAATAAKLGWTIPPDLAIRADRVIE